MVERILIVDVDPNLRFVLSGHLELEGYDVITAASGVAMRAAIEQEQVDLVILDLGLPDEDGLDLAKVLRDKTDAGIIMLTGKGAAGDAVVGLKAGADDYVTKPFDAPELLARIRSVLDRTKQTRRANSSDRAVNFQGWRFEGAYQRLTDPQGNVMTLTGAESRLLQTLIDNAGKTVTRDTLYQKVRGHDLQTDGRGIDVLVGRLRRKLQVGGKEENTIKAVHGVGYEFTDTIE